MNHDFPTAYTENSLQEMINANDSCPSLAEGEVARIVELARQRASARPTPLKDDQVECLVSTDWGNFASDEFGFDNGDMNQFALGVFEGEVSSGKGASLFNDTVVIQNGWLTTGDGRRSQIEPYMDEDYGAAEEGEMWLPNTIQPDPIGKGYLAIIALSEELLNNE